ncbi:LacI family DNA-binding transcriptional regulator [Miniimonas arenae]|uniref:LacI family DNA-binding transcriptional regulator n=1 Tax=Miniimonas arenae TaxID=676201 RepID=UPI0028B0D1C2|nr:LacI family DNA-binding transcriptional regulator [Miniimonas arenae]
MGSMRRTGPTFGLVFSRVAGYRGLSPFYSSLVEGIEDTLAPEGAHLVVRLVDGEDERLATLERWAQAGTVAGVVLNDLVDGDPRPARCADLGLATVVLGDADAEKVGATVIDVDNDGAMGRAVDHLVGLGHRRIARVSGPPDLAHTANRARAFARHVEAAGAQGTTVIGDYSAASGAASLAHLLDAPGPTVTAVLFDNDVMAVAGLAAARARGLSVPRDLSLLAWDDSPECQLAEPALTVMASDLPALGAVVAHALLDPLPVRTVRTEGAKLVPRASTAPVRAPEPAPA